MKQEPAEATMRISFAVGILAMNGEEYVK